MPYSQFTIDKAVEDFDLTIVEGEQFLQNISPIEPSQLLQDTLAETIPWAIPCGIASLHAVSSEKARSEGIINPILLEVKRQLGGQISVFSGEEFKVDLQANLTGYCDFLLSREAKLSQRESAEQLFVKAPAIVLVEAKKEDLKSGLGQCLAELVAAQRFNQQKQQPIPVVYGAITSGTAWRFLKLAGQTVTIDLTDYPLPPVDRILGFLVGMFKDG